jgi:hypothetical protein
MVVTNWRGGVRDHPWPTYGVIFLRRAEVKHRKFRYIQSRGRD